MTLTINASYQGATKNIIFDCPSLPPHALINAQLRKTLGLPHDSSIAWWHIYMTIDDALPAAKFKRHVCSEQEYEEAAKLFRDVTAEIPDLRLSLQVLHTDDPKLNSAKKLHDYQSRLGGQTELSRREQRAKNHLGTLQLALEALIEQEKEIDHLDYAQRLDILQKRAEKMSEIASAKQECNRIKDERRTQDSAQPLDLTVVERELKRVIDARRETAKMIDAYTARLASTKAAQPPQKTQVTKHLSSSNVQAIEATKRGWVHKIPNQPTAAETAKADLPLASTKAAAAKAFANQESVVAKDTATATAGSGGDTARSAGMSAEIPSASGSPAARSLWEYHPVFGQIPSGYAAFPELHDIPAAGHPVTPLHIPLRRLGDAVRDLVPVSQAISAHAQAAAQAASAQMQQQVKETTGAVASDLKSVLEGFLSNLGGQLAVFEEGFKERIDQSVPRATAAVPKAEPDVKLEVGEDVSNSKVKASLADTCAFGNIVCDRCGEHPVAVNLKCKDCRDYDLCVSCLPEILDGNFHPQDHVFMIMTSAPLQDRIHSHRHKERLGHFHHHRHGRSAEGNAGRGQHHQGCELGHEHSTEKHEAFCDLCNKDIRGKRYKCVQCPDWDCCSDCSSRLDQDHPKHSFVVLRKREDYVQKADYKFYHPNVTCDHCNSQILGTRYNCVHEDCPDFDLCEGCEASPKNDHPIYHPLLKLKTPMVQIQATVHASAAGLRDMVEQVKAEEESTRAGSVVQSPTTPLAASTIQPGIVAAQSDAVEAEAEPATINAKEDAPLASLAPILHQDRINLDCAFIRHVTIPDYFCMSPNAGFCKVWAMRNTGNTTIEGECTIRLISGHPFGSISENAHVYAGPGEEFLVTLSNRTVPVLEKSHSGVFQLHDVEGNAFGDELFIEVQVAKPENSDLGSSSLLMPASNGTPTAQPVQNGPSSPFAEPVTPSAGWEDDSVASFSDDEEADLISGTHASEFQPSEFELVDGSDSEY